MEKIKLNEVQDNEIILDIGINTIKILKKKSINPIQFYEWPAGYFENVNFSKGTMSIAKYLKNTIKKSLISVLAAMFHTYQQQEVFGVLRRKDLV